MLAIVCFVYVSATVGLVFCGLGGVWFFCSLNVVWSFKINRCGGLAKCVWHTCKFCASDDLKDHYLREQHAPHQQQHVAGHPASPPEHVNLLPRP